LDEVTVLGTVLGALIVTVIITRMTAGYAACAVIVVLTAAAFTWRNLAPMVAPLAAGVVLGLMNSYPGALRAGRPGDRHGRRDSRPRPFGPLIVFTETI
jgi:hypothetical protein